MNQLRCRRTSPDNSPREYEAIDGLENLGSMTSLPSERLQSHQLTLNVPSFHAIQMWVVYYWNVATQGLSQIGRNVQSAYDTMTGAAVTQDGPTVQPLWQIHLQKWWQKNRTNLLVYTVIVLLLVMLLTIILSFPINMVLCALGLGRGATQGPSAAAQASALYGSDVVLHTIAYMDLDIKYFGEISDIDHTFRCPCSFVQRENLALGIVMLEPPPLHAGKLPRIAIPIDNIVAAQQYLLTEHSAGLGLAYMVPKLWNFTGSPTLLHDIEDGAPIQDADLAHYYHFNPCVASIRESTNTISTYFNPSIPESINNFDASNIERRNIRPSIFPFLHYGNGFYGAKQVLQFNRLSAITVRYFLSDHPKMPSLDEVQPGSSKSINLQYVIMLLDDGMFPLITHCADAYTATVKQNQERSRKYESAQLMSETSGASFAITDSAQRTTLYLKCSLHPTDRTRLQSGVWLRTRGGSALRVAEQTCSTHAADANADANVELSSNTECVLTVTLDPTDCREVDVVYNFDQADIQYLMHEGGPMTIEQSDMANAPGVELNTGESNGEQSATATKTNAGSRMVDGSAYGYPSDMLERNNIYALRPKVVIIDDEEVVIKKDGKPVMVQELVAYELVAPNGDIVLHKEIEKPSESVAGTMDDTKSKSEL